MAVGKQISHWRLRLATSVLAVFLTAQLGIALDTALFGADDHAHNGVACAFHALGKRVDSSDTPAFFKVSLVTAFTFVQNINIEQYVIRRAVAIKSARAPPLLHSLKS